MEEYQLQAPPQEELVIYELLIRDFVTTRNYQTVIDALDYIALSV